MGGLDPAKLLVILVLALVMLGPERLPKAARAIGAFWRDVQAFRSRVEDEVRGAMPDIDIPKIPMMPRGGVTGYLTGMMTSADRSRVEDMTAVDGEDDPATQGDGVATRSAAAARPAAWQSSRFTEEGGNPSPVTAPAGMPAGWHSRGAEAPGWASGSLLSPVPGGGPEGLLGAEARLELSDPSWN